MLKTILKNQIRCRTCKVILTSKHRHDFVMCGCEGDLAVGVDGGSTYLRRLGDPSNWIEMSEEVEYDDQYKMENSDVVMNGVHPPFWCEGRSCPVHTKSNHQLRNAPQIMGFLNSAAVSWRVCEHGIYHIDPDESDDYLAAMEINRKHGGCDGCCGPKGNKKTKVGGQSKVPAFN